jgi:eukaryotic-like serine/threonine-protein kinase
LLPLRSDLTPAGPPHRLTAHNRWSSSPVWAVGGRTLLYVFRNKIHKIDPSHLQASSTRVPSSNVWQISAGPQFVVYSEQSDDKNIWRAKLPAPGEPPSHPELFISSTQLDVIPSYSPDGQEIAFISNRSGSFELWVAKADGSSPTQLTSFGGPLVGIMSWSPDGQSLVFHARPEGQADLYVISAAGGSPKRLTFDPADDIGPSYSHAGRWISFASARTGRDELWKIPALGGAAIQVTWTGGLGPQESFDGKRIYYLSEPDANSILTIPVEGGIPVPDVSSIHSYPAGYTLTTQGLYYPAPPHSENQRFIRFLNFATGENTPVVSTSHTPDVGMSVSPDGRYLLFDQFDELRSDLMLLKFSDR